MVVGREGFMAELLEKLVLGYCDWIVSKERLKYCWVMTHALGSRDVNAWWDAATSLIGRLGRKTVHTLVCYENRLCVGVELLLKILVIIGRGNITRLTSKNHLSRKGVISELLLMLFILDIDITVGLPLHVPCH